MNPHDVRDAVRAGRVVPASNYHAGRRGFGWLQILAALDGCYHVVRDDRRRGGNDASFARAWFALANLPHRRRLRIDFNVMENPDGSIILVVTAYQA